ncbi:DMT family transporter [Roseicella aquatilis]|uniref:DMT family transporter n=1 Tax=Roseicella aquatilis TaxID=2527868 RepID=A0A4R4DVS9_9PROT|nr:DMT family transporter [Roseicella aquatilis]TCZ65406.1 DMT family transporter [Roseicella aquatilis]
MNDTTRRGLLDRPWLLMMLPGLFWAGNAIVGRAVAGEVPPIALAFWRWVLGSAILLPFAWPHLRHDLPRIRRAWPIMLTLSVFGIALFNTMLYVAAQSTTALNIVMLQSSMPVLIVLASFLLFRERVGLRQGIGITVSLLGALTLVTQGDPAMLAGLALNRGDLWMLAAIVSYALYTALLRRRPAVHGLSFAAALFTTGAVLLLPFYAAETLSGRPLPLGAPALLAILYVAVFASVLAYLGYNRAVALLGANTAGLAVHLVPVFGTLLAVVLLGEVPRLYHAIGIALIGFGIWLAQRQRRAA